MTNAALGRDETGGSLVKTVITRRVSMFKAKAAFSGFSVDALAKAKEFYTETLGLKVDDEGVGLRIHLPGSGAVFAYPKADHQPATFTILNFVVEKEMK